MSIRRALRLPAALVIGLSVLTRAVPAVDPESRPNIVLCMTDDQGWGDTGYNGNPILKTPHLDEMARHGLRFDRFYAAQHNCSPTRASVLTGRHPNRVRCYAWGHDLPLAEVTIAEVAHSSGYATGHFGKWHLGGIPNTPGGDGRGVPADFDKGLRHPGNQGFDTWFSAGNFFDRDPPHSTIFANGRPVEALRGDTSDIIAGQAIRFISTQASSKTPFLAVVWFPSPHSPHRPLEDDASPYRPLGEAASFYGEMAGVDRAMGRLRDALERLGIRDNTLLWFTSDNGAAAGSTGGLSGEKGSLQEGGIRVPGLIEWPAKIRKPSRTNVPACTTDIFPTLLEVMAAAPPSGGQVLDGVSLVPLIEGKTFERGSPIGFEDTDPRSGKARNTAWIDGRWKLLGLARPEKRGKSTDKKSSDVLAPGFYLFDLEADPGELRDLKNVYPDRCAAMKQSLAKWQESVALSASEYPLELPAVPDARVSLNGVLHNPLLVDRLRSSHLRERWASGDLSSFDSAWTLEDDSLRGTCGANERIVCSTPVRHTDALVQVSVQLRGDSLASVQIESNDDTSMVVTLGSKHIELSEVSPRGDENLRKVLIESVPAVVANSWNTLHLEYVGHRAVLRFNGNVVGRTDQLSVGSEKQSISLRVEGEGASFRDLRSWELRAKQ